MSYDSILKYLIEQYPQAFVNWLLKTETTQVKILNVELNVEPIRVDGLFFLQTSSNILHLEFQTSTVSKPPIPARMLDYWMRLYRQYGDEIDQVVVFLKPTNDPIAYQTEFKTKNTTHRYQVVRIWECEPEIFLNTPGLLPLAVLAKTSNPEQLLETVALETENLENSPEKINISACIQLLAGLNYSESLISMYFKEEIMQESVIYQKILEKGLQQGLTQGRSEGLQQGLTQGRSEGRSEGLQQGRSEGEMTIVTRLLTRRFGEIPQLVTEKLEKLSTNQLEELADRLLDEFTQISQVISWLETEVNEL